MLDGPRERAANGPGAAKARALGFARVTVRLLVTIAAAVIALGGLTQGIDVLVSWVHRFCG